MLVKIYPALFSREIIWLYLRTESIVLKLSPYMEPSLAVVQTDIENATLVHRGKVRDVYAIDDEHLLLVASDRISAFDCVFPTPIPGKGAILTALSEFWFKKLTDITPNHLISTDQDRFPEPFRSIPELKGRSSLVKRTDVFPVECVVRGYLEGSGWKDYKATGKVCGYSLPPGLKQCDRLLDPIFTPATKAASGHDDNITGLEFKNVVGSETAGYLKAISLKIFEKASKYAKERGIIIADTKFEFGIDKDGEILLIDEVLTPDSSRFWDAEKYEPGHAQPSFDKQFLREYLETLDWEKTPPAPPLPDDVVEKTLEKYTEAYDRLTS
jgi:phosphoribosylaminoimidazole-succinocarboxamide synthase